MEENKLTHKPHVGPKPVEAKPNHVREKTYEASHTPQKVKDEDRKTPDSTARDKTSDEMGEATRKVKKRL